MTVSTCVTDDSSPSVAERVSILYIKENKEEPFVQRNFISQLDWNFPRCFALKWLHTCYIL